MSNIVADYFPTIRWQVGVRNRIKGFIVAGVVTVAVGVGVWQTIPTGGDGVTCLVSNRNDGALAGTDCDAGTTLFVNNAVWQCTQPVSNYATSGLPLRVVQTWTTSGGGNNVSFGSGCTGDGNPDTIDIIGQTNAFGNSSGVGPSADGAKLQPDTGPRNIQITGNFDCGVRAAGAHQDAFQFQGGQNVAIVNGTTGRYAAGESSCQGAGGGIFYSIGTQSNVDVIGGEGIVCNQNIFRNSELGQGNEVIDAKFRVGRVSNNGDPADGDTPNCVNDDGSPFSSAGPCLQVSGLDAFTNVTCEDYVPATNSWVEVGSTP